MLIGLILSIIVAWFGFMGLAASMLVGQATGMFWYGMITMVAGAAASIFLKKSEL